MTYVEIKIIDHRTMKLGGTYNKVFTSGHEFMKWYDVAKLDDYMIINVMSYNPIDNKLKKDENDLELIRTKSGMPT